MRPPGRRRGINRIGRSRSDGAWLGYGRQKCDDVLGYTFPARLMTRDACGNLVSRYHRDGSLDRTGGVWGQGRCEAPAKGRTLVSVTATDAAADTTGDPGQFTISRTGDVTAPMTVYYGVGGSAVAGTDYSALSGVVQFAAGETTKTVTVTPVVDAFSSGTKTVVLTVAANPTQVYAIPIAAMTRPVNPEDLPTIPDVQTPYVAPNQTDVRGTVCGYNEPATLSATAMVTITGVTTSVTLLLRYEFTSGSFLVNSGTAGTGFNLLQNEDCVEEG